MAEHRGGTLPSIGRLNQDSSLQNYESPSRRGTLPGVINIASLDSSNQKKRRNDSAGSARSYGSARSHRSGGSQLSKRSTRKGADLITVHKLVNQADDFLHQFHTFKGKEIG